MSDDYQNLLAKSFFTVFFYMAAGSPNWLIAEELGISEDDVEQMQQENMDPARLSEIWKAYCKGVQNYRDAISSGKMPWDDEEEES